MSMIPDTEPDKQVQAAGDDAHILGLRQGLDRLDDLAEVHPGPRGDRDIHDDRVAERRPVDVDPVAADDPAAFQSRQPIGDSRGGHLDRSRQRSL